MIFFCALAPIKQERYDGGRRTSRDEAITTQGTVATGIHTTTIAMIFSLNNPIISTQGVCPLTYLLVLPSL